MANVSGIPIDIIGLDRLIQQLGGMPASLEQELDAELAASANDFVNRAVQAAPVDTNVLRNGISFQKLDKMQYEVISAAGYSAYVEWGTITFVKVPPELQSYALQFKGKGILKTGGMKAKPFFFVQLPKVQKQLDKNLNKAVRRALTP